MWPIRTALLVAVLSSVAMSVASAPARALDPAACGVSPISDAPVSSGELIALRQSTKPDALYRLGLASATGRVVAQDCKAAASLMMKAAALHHPAAENAFGEIAEAGSGGVPRDDRTAAKWYRAAADAGDPQAEYNLGRLIVANRAFEYGAVTAAKPQTAWGFSDDLQSAGHETQASEDERYARAATLWEQSAKAGNPPAMYQLAGLYARGRGVPQNTDRAQQLYRAAAAAGVPGAQHDLNALLGKPD